MEYVNCNLCGLDEPQLLFKKKDKFAMTQDEYRVVGCRGCGLLYPNPRPAPEEIGRFYPEGYSWRETFKAESLFTKWIRRRGKAYRYHLLRDEVSKILNLQGRILET